MMFRTCNIQVKWASQLVGLMRRCRCLFYLDLCFYELVGFNFNLASFFVQWVFKLVAMVIICCCVMHFFAFRCIFLFDMGVGASSLVRDTNLTIEKLQINYHAFEANHDVVGIFLQALQTPFKTSQLNVANIFNMGKGCTLVL
jgi:hypothetical protein